MTAAIGGHPELHPGASAEMSIVIQEATGVLTVPTSAIHTAGSATHVLVPREGRQVPQPATIGASGPARTQITSGLRAGDTVVIAVLH